MEPAGFSQPDFVNIKVNEELLDYAPIATKIFVGKRKGFKAYSQQEINLLLVKYAFSHKNVVRLKGGDSYVFGRGFEELQYVESFFAMKSDVFTNNQNKLL
jgi:siroheme synthase